jgi:ubiquinol-cytochrome c reductase cytochrome c subunit
MRKMFFCVAGATFSVAAFLASSAFGAQAAAPAGNSSNGKASFERVGCWQCHGLQGQGGREGPRIASPVPMPWPPLSRFVRTSRGNMPPYTETVLSDHDLADIYAFLRSIPPAPDFKTIAVLNDLLTTASEKR